jgi:predicted flap endonuclease-1-like 5' DNA nuclease
VVSLPAAVVESPKEPRAVRRREKASPDDEAAAMRAIEGNWSPKRGAARAAKSVAPEGVADAEPEAAALEPIEKPAAPAETFGRPVGIDAPRHGVKDNLTNIIGVLPIIETALNNIGVYHFDQIAEFSDDNVAWLEGHLAIAGRVTREHWREQARELAVVSERARKVAGQQ